DRTAMPSDVGEFRAALAAGEHERAAHLAKGPFLDGFSLSGAPRFDRWVEEERATLANEVARAMLSLAREAEARQDHDAAADWWRHLTVLDPVSGRYALGFVRTLA